MQLIKNKGITNMNTKRFISIILCILICLSMCACGLINKPEPETTTKRPEVRVTFPEGYTVLQIANLLEEKEVCSAAEFMDACKTIPEGYENLICPESADNKIFILEGYVFPDTYDFFVGEGAKNALSRFLSNAKSKVSDEYFARADELGMSMYEVFTLASIIQSECSNPEEMANVSSVFHNRLEKAASGFPYIGSDVTRQYIGVKMKEYIEKNGLDYDALFGAYCTNDGYDLKTMGLPTGPVCNPGSSAIKAALYPSDTDYLYFFTDKNGGFHYNMTLAKHQSEYNNLQK